MILLVIDLSQADPCEQYRQMINALDSFATSLLKEKKLIVVGNKVDAPNAKENLVRLNEAIDQFVIPISTKEKINLRKFMRVLRDVYESNQNSC